MGGMVAQWEPGVPGLVLSSGFWLCKSFAIYLFAMSVGCFQVLWFTLVLQPQEDKVD